MHGAEVRHVRTLRLRAPEAKFVRRGVTLLEDALHTASVPGATHGRVLCIRSLPVGVIRPEQSAASLALAIERQLQHLHANAVHVLTPGAMQQPAVYFRDDIEPYVLLALQLARNQPVAGWFWPMVVPAWQPGLSRAEAFRRVVFGVMQTRAGAAAAVHIIRVLHEAQLLAPLCAALQPTDGSALLRAYGWTASPPVPHRPTLHEMPLPVGWTTLIRQWARRWGCTEPRTLWLVAMGSAIRQPLRLLDPLLMQRVLQVVAQAAGAGDTGTSEAATTPAARDQVGERSGATAVQAPVDGDAETPETGMTPAARDRVSGYTGSGSETTLREEMQKRHPEARETRTTPTRQSTVRVDAEHDAAATQRMVAPPTQVVTDNRASSGVLEQNPAYETEMSRQQREWPTEPQSTAYAGLFFLLLALERLGIATFLTSHPHWLAHDLPRRLLQGVCAALAVPDDDPILAALSWAYATEEAATTENFVAPENWRQAGCASPPWRLSRMATDRGRRVLCDMSGRLPVAVWSDAAPEAVRRLIDGQPIRKGPIHPQRQPLTANTDAVALGAWHTALRRWCRRYAGIGLATLVHRPGRILWTQTHIDMIFRHTDTDLRIRRAGLDLTLGWVPWLSRVVTFHYVEREV